MSEGPERVVIASRYWPTALSLVRSLGAAGFAVDLAASVPRAGESRFAAASKYVSRYAETVCKSIKRADDPELLRVLTEFAVDEDGDTGMKPVLLPADDYTASLIDRNHELLRPLYVIPDAMGGRQGAITELMDKGVQGRLAAECGLPCPAEWIIDLRDISIPEEVAYPCYCKPVISYVGFKGEMARCDGPKELRDHLEFLRSRNPDREILVQEFIDIDSEISISGVSIRSQDKNSVRVIVPAVIKKGMPAKFERGVAICGTLEPYDVLGGLRGGIEKLFNRMDYNGMFDMDFHCSGDRIYFGEVNLRSGGTCYAYYQNGVDLPAITVKGLRYGAESLEGEAVTLREYGRSFVYERVLWKDYLQGYLTRSKVRDILDSADSRLISDPDDPAPGEAYEKYVRESIRKNRTKGLKTHVKDAVRPVLRPLKGILRGYPQYKPGNSRKNSAGPRAMIVGRNYSSNLCMARSLGMAGYDVEIMRVYSRSPAKGDVLAEMMPDAYSRYVKAFHTCTLNGKTTRGADALLAAADSNRKMLLIPTDDISVYIADESYDRLSEYYCMANIGGRQGEIVRLMSKDLQKKLAEECDLPMPGSCLVKCSGGRYDIPEDVNYPCFIKPDVSCKSSKKRMKRCGSKEELRTALDEIVKTAEPDLLIEDYVDVKRELSLLGLCADGKVLCPGMIEATSGGHGARRGVAAAGVSMIPVDKSIIDESTLEKIRDFMLSTGYEGLFDIDLIETEDGRQYFLEVNLRYGASGYTLTCGGLNLPGIFADHVMKGAAIPDEDELIGSIPGDNSKASFASEKVLLENYSEGVLTEEEMQQEISYAEVHFVRSDDDMQPYRRFMQAFEKIKKQRKN